MIEINQDILLNIAHISTSTRNLGPGERSVVWVQGCHKSCPGCIAAEWLSFEDNQIMPVTGLVDILLSSESIEGLTFSGGEPMEQAGGLAALARLARTRKDLNIICFTGYTYELLINNPPNPGVLDLLQEIDVLIDGVYVRDMNDGVGLRGSSNQRIIHLTPRLKNENLENLKRSVEIILDDDHIRMVGIPPRNMESVIDLVKRSTSAGVKEVGYERI